MDPGGAAPTAPVRTPPKSWPDLLLVLALSVAAAAVTAVDLLVLEGPTLVSLAALAVLAAILAARVAALLRKNRRLHDGFTASDEFKTQLLRFISHEIANPLSPLRLQTSLLQDGKGDPARAWPVVERSLNRLESLSRDVRLMALVETHRLVQSTEVADVTPRVAGAVQTYQGMAAQRGVTLSSTLPPAPLAVPIDGERFDQVVDNLLSNALKFTPPGGTVDVQLWKAPGGVAVLEIADSGAGMSPEQQERLFSAFGRPQGSTTPGLGLGLYLCKAIVDGHGGRISATSEGQGRGSRFRVELPPARAAGGRRSGPKPEYRPQVNTGAPTMAEGRPPDLPV